MYNDITSFLPYKFNGEKYHTVQALVEALLKIPDKGINELKNGKLTQHFGYFDPIAEVLCLKTENSICENENENYHSFFHLMYQLNPSEKRIFCGSKEYSDIFNLAEDCIAESVIIACKDGVNGSSEFINYLLLMLECGFLEEYISNFSNTEIINSISNCNRILHDGKFKYSPVQKTLIFGYYLCSCRKLVIQGKSFESPEEFYNEMKKFQENDKFNYPKFISDIKNELEFYLNVLPDEVSKNFIQKIYDDLMTAIFGDYEYVFKNGEDFNQFVDKLIKNGKLYEVESLLNRYYLALQDVSREIWKNDAFLRLCNLVDKFIHFGEYIFKDKKDIKQFIERIVLNHKDNPLYLKRFFLTYRSFITTLENKDKEFINIFSSIKKLNLDKEVIELDEYIFISEEECVAFLIKLKLEHPLKIKDFVNLHKDALLNLSKHSCTKSVIDNLFKIANLNAPSSSIFLDNRTFYSIPISGQYIKFGNYWYDNSSKKSPIEWIVLRSSRGNIITLVSKYGLDYQLENKEGSNLSKWLYSFFLENAFSKSEKNMIDFISVPTKSDIRDDNILICKPTPYTEALMNHDSRYKYFCGSKPYRDSDDRGTVYEKNVYIDMIDEKGGCVMASLPRAGIVRPLMQVRIGTQNTRSERDSMFYDLIKNCR